VSNPGLRKQQIPLGTSICVPELEPDPSWADTLRNSQPELSAASPLCRWQRAALGFLATGLPLGIVLSPDATAMVVMALLTPAFFCVALLRAAAVADFASRRIDGQPGTAIAAADLPIYSILVPLYREAHMAQSLVAALEREPNQLQRAYRRFLTGAPELGCLQARLNIYNPQDSWITRGLQ
jgi:hypothetical protein